MITRIFNSGRFAKDGNGGQYLQRRSISAARHHHVRFDGFLIVAGPLPDTDSFGAMDNCGVHCQPLREGVFAGNHYIDVIPAAQAVIKDGKQAIGVGRQIDAHNVGLLVNDVIEETRILMCETVVILLPHMGGKQVIERRNLSPPWQLQTDFQPLRVLAEHRVDDANEGLIAIE